MPDERTDIQPSTSTHGGGLPEMHLIILVSSLCIGLFVSILDTTIVATALDDIGAHFLATKTVTWVALAYSLAYVGFALPLASLSDVIGRRNAWTASVLLFVTFSLACGFARTLTELVAFRAIQGIGGSGLYSVTMIMLPELAPPHAQKWIGALAGMVIATAGVVGPVVGGVITRYTTWRWIFWINGPIAVGPAILLCLFWPKTTHERQSMRFSIKELDFVGTLLLIAASVLVVLAFQQGGLHPTSWDTALFLAPLLVGCFLWAVLFLWEARMSHRHPDSRTTILPLRLTTRRRYMSVVLCTALTGFVYFVAIFRLPLQFQIVNGSNSLKAGVDLLPLLGSVAIGSILGGLTMKHTFPALAVSTALMALGAGLLSTLSVHTGVQNKTYGYEILLGLGIGISVSTSTVFANISTGPDDKAIANGIVAQARVFGGSIGIAASTAILGVISEHTLEVRLAYAESFSKSMWVASILACLAFVASFGLLQKRVTGRINERSVDVEEPVMVLTGDKALS